MGKRWATAIAGGACLAWVLVSACGSERPPGADLNRPPSEGGDPAPELDAGLRRDTPDGTIECPDVPYGLQLFPEGGPTECVCLHKNSDGLVARIPCKYGVCVSSANAGWFCSERQQLFYVPGANLGRCDASAVPPDAKPCAPTF
ncbi:MAG: hypothetical protein JST00_05185 [Deltaproteobacteria bacterium]|nr:hypothetical protein [Deltaproteobacteria bacterium]